MGAGDRTGLAERMTEPDPGNLLRRLHSRRAATRAVLLFERLWPAVWPAVGISGVFVCLALLDLPGRLTPWLHVLLLAGFGLAVLVLLVRGLRSVAWPGNTAADRRLEHASGLVHRPLAALSDRPSGDDPLAAALWQTHLARAAQQVRSLRVGLPSPGLAAIDRRALRAGLLVALLACIAIAGRDAPALVAQAMTPSWPLAAAGPGTEVQAWITPPAYTRLPPIFLNQGAAAVSSPVGSRLTVSVTGGRGMEGHPASVLMGASEIPLHALDKSSFQGEQELHAGGRLSVHQAGRELAAWTLTVVADRPPSVAWADRPSASTRGPQLRLPWQAEDDYGVVSLRAEMVLNEPVDPPPAALGLTLPLPGDIPLKAQGVATQDLSAHPWAGLAVRGKLIVRDAAGQVGQSAEIGFTLPERQFQNPLARILIELRRSLTLHPKGRESVLAALDQLLQAPKAFEGDLGTYLNLAGIYFTLVRDKMPEAVPASQQRMWELALQLEDGQVDRSAKALENARQAARDALDKAAKEPNQANLADVDRKLKELEEAIQNRLQAMLEQARRDGTEEQIDPQAMQMDAKDLEKMAEAAREAAKEGRMDDAKQQLAELEEMLDQLKNGQSANAQAAQKSAQQRAEKRQRGEKQVGVVQDMIARQGGLLDHSQQRGQDRPTDPKPADKTAGRQADKRVQQALRRALGELMQQFGDLTGEVPPGLSDADTAMRDAGQALGQGGVEGSDPAAMAAQQRAIEALQKGGREMGQAMAKKFGPGQMGVGQAPGEGDDPNGDATGRDPGGRDRAGPRSRAGLPPGRGNGRDPFGRQEGQGTAGADEGGDVRVPEERERQRAQAIQEELRRRGADRSRSQEELDYIDRLLKRF
jgi:uncharacterized protein (TIGR02302 family)